MTWCRSKQGWDAYVTAAFSIYFPDTDGVIPFLRWSHASQHAVHLRPQVRDRFGYIYHPAYRSLWCDNEFQQVSWTLDKSVFINETIIEHQHYTNGYGQPDALMRYTERLYTTLTAGRMRKMETNEFLVEMILSIPIPYGYRDEGPGSTA